MGAKRHGGWGEMVYHMPNQGIRRGATTWESDNIQRVTK